MAENMQAAGGHTIVVGGNRVVVGAHLDDDVGLPGEKRDHRQHEVLRLAGVARGGDLLARRHGDERGVRITAAAQAHLYESLTAVERIGPEIERLRKQAADDLHAGSADRRSDLCSAGDRIEQFVLDVECVVDENAALVERSLKNELVKVVSPRPRRGGAKHAPPRRPKSHVRFHFSRPWLPSFRVCPELPHAYVPPRFRRRIGSARCPLRIPRSPADFSEICAKSGLCRSAGRAIMGGDGQFHAGGSGTAMEWTTTTTLLDGLRRYADDDAWRRFVEQFRTPVVRFARSAGLSEHDANDLAQETFLAFAEAYRRGDYDRKKGRLSRWLFGIAYKHILRHRQRAARRRTGTREGVGTHFWLNLADENEATTIWDQEWERQLWRQCIERVRPEFEPSTMAAFELAVGTELSAQEAAQQLGVPVKSIYNAKHRVLKRLREIRAEVDDA
ncbi:MAG: sigma-70 family RNA polymerase sigma factor [Planctomycetota bacterium]|nr:MAG: sigma-70 family RNA polymerase sigma factor [Planctomycetota bacterium]